MDLARYVVLGAFNLACGPHGANTLAKHSAPWRVGFGNVKEPGPPDRLEIPIGRDIKPENGK